MKKHFTGLCAFAILCASALLSLPSCSRDTPEEMFYQAASNWNVSDIRDELQDGADVNTRFTEHDDMTPLMVAARAHHPEPVRYLLRAGADVAAVDAQGLTALDHAERSRAMLCRDILLAAGATPGHRKGIIPKHASEPAPPSWKDREFDVDKAPMAQRAQKHTLHDACDRADAELVVYHLQNGADVNARDEKGRTPLMLAVQSICSTTACEWITAHLLAAGAEVDATDNEGRSVLYFATKQEHAPSDVVPMLLEAGAAPTGWTDPDFINFRAESMEVHNLHDACQAADQPAVRRYLAAGADVNALDEAGWSPLMLVVSYQRNLEDREKIVALLLEAGADVNAVDSEGKNALFLAVESGYKHNGIVPMLLAAGADATIRAKSGASVVDALPYFLNSSSEKQRAERVTAMLQEHGAPEGAIMGFMDCDIQRHDRGLQRYPLEEGGGTSISEILPLPHN